MAFLDILFPPTINQGASGGPGYVTRITPKDGGDEAVDQRWATHLGRWDVSKGLQTQLQLDELQVFHIVAKGRANSFRFKDFKDFEVGVTAFKTGRLGTSAVGTGFPTYQLVKRYVNAAGSEDKTIYLPTNNAAFVVKRNGSPVTVGGGAGQISINFSTGVVTFVADSSKAITGITKANPGNVTCVGHGFSTGTLIHISGVGGMTQVNNLVFTITNVDADHFTLGVDTTAYGTYTSGGTAAKYPQAADALTWVGEHEKHCRFDIDHMKPNIAGYNNYAWGQILVVEKRRAPA